MKKWNASHGEQTRTTRAGTPCSLAAMRQPAAIGTGNRVCANVTQSSIFYSSRPHGWPCTRVLYTCPVHVSGLAPDRRFKRGLTPGVVCNTYRIIQCIDSFKFIFTKRVHTPPYPIIYHIYHMYQAPHVPFYISHNLHTLPPSASTFSPSTPACTPVPPPICHSSSPQPPRSFPPRCPTPANPTARSTPPTTPAATDTASATRNA